MYAIMRIFIVCIIMIPYTSSSMFLRIAQLKKRIRYYSSASKPQSFNEILKRTGRTNCLLVSQMSKRNKKLQEILDDQNKIINEYKSDKENQTWYISEHYAHELYWSETELLKIANTKH